MRIRQETSVSLESRVVLAQERVVLVVLHCPTSSKKTSTTVWKRPTLTRKPSGSGRKPFTKNAPRANSPKHIFTNFSNRYLHWKMYRVDSVKFIELKHANTKCNLVFSITYWQNRTKIVFVFCRSSRLAIQKRFATTYSGYLMMMDQIP